MTRAKFFKKPLFAFGLGLLVLPLGAGDCQPRPPGPCDPSNATTCEGDTICHPILLECVPNCAREGNECSGETPVCSFGEDQLDDPRFNNVCICDDASCPDGTVCHYGTHLCEETCDPEVADACPEVSGQQWEWYEYEGTGLNVCQPPPGACNAPGGSCDDPEFPICDASTGECIGRCDSDVDPKLACAETELCDEASGECVPKCAPIGDVNADGDVCTASGVYETPCDNQDDCLATEELCQTDVAAAEFNQCVDPDTATATCPAANAFTGGRETNGPLIWDVTLESDDDNIAKCANFGAAGSSPYLITFFIHDPNDDVPDDPGGNDFLWAREGENPMSGTNSPSSAVENGLRVGLIPVCFVTAPDEVAVQIKDNAGHRSNVACGPLLN